MKYVDPVKNPNLWLEKTLQKMIEDGKPEDVPILKDAIRVIVHWLEPGLVDQLFGEWIQSYLDAVNELESSRNNVDPPCSLEASEE
tara:strand:- start:718 stop:975 length:258 start_codon:yes stop_codon:yes gene_type:complete